MVETPKLLEPESEPMPSPAIHVGPDHLDMYILLAGLVVGLALSPWIAGRMMSIETYEKWYQGAGQEYDAFRTFALDQAVRVETKKREAKAQLEATGVTEVAISEALERIDAQAREELLPYTKALAKAREEHRAWLVGFVGALVAATALVMFIEPVFEPRGRTALIRRRLVTGRYVLIAAWIGTALAQPTFLTAISPVFVILLVAVAVLAALLPWLLAGKQQ